MTIVIDNHTYDYDEFGALNQIAPAPFIYDEDYVSLYDDPAYVVNEAVLMSLRVEFVADAFGRMPQSLFDFGYGNGAFMRHASQAVHRVVGLDPANRPVLGCKTMTSIVPTEVLTMWDVIEHLPSLDFLADIPQQMLVVSTPFCHVRTSGIDWFATEYHHRKPNEHIRHFDDRSLTATLASLGWDERASSPHEDVIRKGRDDRQNILSAAYVRR